MNWSAGEALGKAVAFGKTAHSGRRRQWAIAGGGGRWTVGGGRWTVVVQVQVQVGRLDMFM